MPCQKCKIELNEKVHWRFTQNCENWASLSSRNSEPRINTFKFIRFVNIEPEVACTNYFKSHSSSSTRNSIKWLKCSSAVRRSTSMLAISNWYKSSLSELHTFLGFRYDFIDYIAEIICIKSRESIDLSLKTSRHASSYTREYYENASVASSIARCRRPLTAANTSEQKNRRTHITRSVDNPTSLSITWSTVIIHILFGAIRNDICHVWSGWYRAFTFKQATVQ